MNIPGKETEPSADATSQDTVSATSSPNLLGPTIFVYIISILAGLIGGLLTALLVELFSWSNITGYVAPIAGLIGGVVAAWFWTKLMTFFVRRRASTPMLAIFGILSGLISGWIASIILWLFVGIISIASELREITGIYFYAAIGVGIFGSIIGIWIGIICSIFWTIWTRNIHR